MRRLFLIAIIFCTATWQAYAQREGMVHQAVSKGIASFYHDKFEGRLTANGEVFDNNKFTAASNILKLGSYVKVTNLSNGKVVYVKINDRMAHTNTRLIDLARVAAKELGFIRKGITQVKVEVVPESEGKIGIVAQREGIALVGKNEL